MKTILWVLLLVNFSLAFVAKNSQKRISEQKCEEYAKNSTFSANEYQMFNCSLRLHELIREDQIGFNPSEFRHLAKIYSENHNHEKKFICNGALISEQYVVTSAECLGDRTNIPTWIRLGESDLQTTYQDFYIMDLIPHPEYTKSSAYHNIALLKLDRDALFSPLYVLPACLHAAPDVQEQEKVFITGWGVRNIDKKLDYEVDDGAAPQHCEGLLDEHGEKVFCAQNQLCEWMQINTGAPLQIERKDIGCMHDLLGLTLLTPEYTCKDNPDINLNVNVYEYLDWIESIVWPQSV